MTREEGHQRGVTAMEQPIVTSTANTEEREGMSPRDVLAMLSMLDYLIAQVAQIDGMSAHCLVLARKSLATAGDGRAKAH